MELGIRLSNVEDLVKAGNCIADIGCDHGMVSIRLIQDGKAKKVIACDINKGPLEKAKENIDATGLKDFVEVRQGDGLKPLSETEADGILIAGMGGPLGLRILYEGRDRLGSVTQVVLQLQSKLPLVRFILKEWGFETEEERFVYEDGKYYPMFRVTPPGEDFTGLRIDNPDDYFSEKEKEMEKLTTEELCNYSYGEALIRDKSPLLEEFLQKEEERILEILEHLEESEEETANGRRSALLRETDAIMMARWKILGRA